MCVDRDCNPQAVDRRGFVLGAALAGIGAVAPPASAEDVKPPTRVLDEVGIQHGRVVFTHAGRETFDGYLARPKGDGAYPAVLVVAGNRITEEYIPNTCAALALAGFVGLAPNVFHPLPETARTREEMQAALKDHTDSDVLQDLQVGADYLKAQPFVRDGGVGVVGFCYGGRLALLFAARSLEVDAVVPFHPAPVGGRQLARLRAPAQFHHGTADGVVDVAKTRETAAALKAQKSVVETHYYDGADHGFLAYTRPTYRPDDAKLAWSRAVAFLRNHIVKS